MPISQSLCTLLLELFVRAALCYLSLTLDAAVPFERTVRREEAWLYSYPRTHSYVPTNWLLVVVVTVIPAAALLSDQLVSRWRIGHHSPADISDAVAALLAWSLTMPLNGVITNSLKVTVGRPRPDFLQRCYGVTDGALPSDLNAPCTGNVHTVNEGRKSFPSGHSSYAFAAATFISLYWAHRWGVFRRDDAGSAARARAPLVALVVAPLLGAALVAVSRTCDYHHHWQDVVAGSVLGSVCAWLAFSQYFPSRPALVHLMDS